MEYINVDFEMIFAIFEVFEYFFMIFLFFLLRECGLIKKIIYLCHRFLKF